MTPGAEQLASPGPGQGGSEVWTVLRLMEWSGEYLVGKGVEQGRLDAEHLLAHVTGIGRLELYLQYDRPMLAEELDRYRPFLKRRAGREPLQYILERAPFRHLELHVDPSVLIPRPETEVLLDEVLDWAKAEGREDMNALDLGTGSGAIALSLALEGPFERVVATDTSQAALEVARRNCARAGLEDKLEFRHGAYYEPVDASDEFDVIASNPPYVADGEGPSLQPEVRDWEPVQALFAGQDGLRALRTIVAGAGSWLVAGGLLALEVGLGQAGLVAGLLEDTSEYAEVRVRRDFTGRERMVLARRIG